MTNYPLKRNYKSQHLYLRFYKNYDNDKQEKIVFVLHLKNGTEWTVGQKA